ncbi:MAG: hypothetical protein ABI565_06355 [Vicinamibacteria bacterium]
MCNGLSATIGLGQRRGGATEAPIVTAGDNLTNLGRLLHEGRRTYSAAEVTSYLLGRSEGKECDARLAARSA